MGGALGAVAMIALLVLGGVAMVMFMAGQQNPTRPSTDSKGQSSDQSSMNRRRPPHRSVHSPHRVSSAGRRYRRSHRRCGRIRPSDRRALRRAM